MTWKDYHGFPKEVDAFGADGETSTITGRSGIPRTLLKIHGVYGLPGGQNGVEGEFEYIISPDGEINHRFFRPYDFPPLE